MQELGFGSRLGRLLTVFFRFLFDGAFASRVVTVWDRLPEPPPPPPQPKLPEPPKPEPKVEPKIAPPDHASALVLLGILQREGRFVDFLQESIDGFGDADVGAAARVVHTGCKKALADHLVLEPIRTEGEGAAVTLPKGFDASAVRLTGNVTGEPPFKGTLRHHGWRAASVKLPGVVAGHDSTVVAPAEVEL